VVFDPELLEVDAVTGRRSNLAAMVHRAVRALEAAEVPYAVVGAAALAARGLPRMTRDLDVVVTVDDAFSALDALEGAGFRSVTPVRRSAEPEPMYVLEARRGGEVDLLVAAGEPESTIIAEPSRAALFGALANVATLEQLLLMYLYSNQPKHLGDFHRIVVETGVDVAAVERYLADVHPEMLPTLGERVHAARNPPPPPPRPARKRRTA
jgi:hypothetical protein